MLKINKKLTNENKKENLKFVIDYYNNLINMTK